MNQPNFTNLQSEFDEHYTKYIHSLSSELLEYLKTKIINAKHYFNITSSIQLELVVDTNIVFSEVRSLVINKRSFFLTLADNPFLKIYAPPQLKEELLEKIKLKFPKDKQTKDFDIDECLKKAELFLSKITLIDKWEDSSWNKAKEILKNRDIDDVSFVALNFSLKGHGVITMDKDISDQKEVMSWTLKDVGGVVTEVGKGSFSFFVINTSTPTIFKLIYHIALIVWKAFMEVVTSFIMFCVYALEKGITAAMNVHPALGVIFLTLFVVADDFRENVGNFLSAVWVEIKKIVVIVKTILQTIWTALKEFISALKPLLDISIEFFQYLLYTSTTALSRLEELEKSRAT